MEDQGEAKQRVALYLRVSTDEQVEKYGIDLQRSALEGLVSSKPNSMVLAGEKYVYIDYGVSGTVDIDERPAFCQLKEDLINSPPEDRPFDVVAVYKIDRFARQLRILLEVIDLFEQYDIKFLSANESIDTSTPFGKAMLGIIGVIAELERDTIAKRTKDGRWEAFEEGVVLGSGAPYGYTKDERKKYKVLEPEARVVRDIFNMFVYEGRSIDGIARYLEEHKIPSPAASAVVHKKHKREARKKNGDYFWGAGTVRRLLAEEIYMGRIYGNKYQKGKVLDKSERVLSRTAAPVIVDAVLFDKAQRILSQSKHQKKYTKDGHIYLLSTLLKCDCCYDQNIDEVRVGWHGERRDMGGGKKQYYYKCGRKNRSKTTTVCSSLPLPAEEIEDYVVAYSKKLLKNPIAVFEYQKKLKSRLKTIEHLRKQDSQLLGLIEAVPRIRSRLLVQHAEGLLATPALKIQLKKQDEDLLRYQRTRDAVQIQMAQHSISKEYIDTLDLFSGKYNDFLRDDFTDRATLSLFLHQLIEEIVVYTRPLKGTDIVAGPRKDGQQMPYRIHIKLKLPQDIFAEISKQPIVSSEKLAASSGQKSTSGAG